MNEFRENLIEEMKGLWRDDPTIHAVFEGGSAATGYLDEFSDLDLVVVCDDDAIDRTFSGLEAFLASRHAVRIRYCVPEPTPHGHPQRFYLLKSGPPFFYLDVLVQKLADAGGMIETDRHGTMVFWFDKTNSIRQAPSAAEDIQRRNRAILESVPGSFEIMVIEVKKNIVRGHLTDAMMFYQALLMRHLAPLLNLKFRPTQSDFGIRYAWRAYPPDIAAMCLELMMVRDRQDLEKKLETVIETFTRLLAELTATAR